MEFTNSKKCVLTLSESEKTSIHRRQHQPEAAAHSSDVNNSNPEPSTSSHVQECVPCEQRDTNVKGQQRRNDAEENESTENNEIEVIGTSARRKGKIASPCRPTAIFRHSQGQIRPPRLEGKALTSEVYDVRSQLSDSQLEHTVTTDSESRSFQYGTCNKMYDSQSSLNAHSTTCSEPNTSTYMQESVPYGRSCWPETNFQAQQETTNTEGNVLPSDVTDGIEVTGSSATVGFQHNALLTAHPYPETRPLKCYTCDKVYKSESSLTAHRRYHELKKSHECRICRKLFISQSLLKRHERVHTGEKPFECEICKKTFNDNSSVNRHKVVHTELKPFECEICKKTFSDKSNLNRHKVVHTQDKPYQCQVCKQRFRLKHHLHRHQNLGHIEDMSQ